MAMAMRDRIMPMTGEANVSTPDGIGDVSPRCVVARADARPADEAPAHPPTHPYTQALLSAIPKPDPRQRRIHQRFRYNA